MPESLESRYALSALPPHLRDGATVLLLDPAKGYAVSRLGTNGFSCIVVRSDWQFPTRPFRDDIFWPVCFDAEGSRTLMHDYLTAAELRARGTDAKQVHHEITKKFGTAGYPNPARVGVAYVIAPIIRTVDDTNVPEPKTMNMPHYMFYAPNVKNSDIGGKPISQYPFMLSMSPGEKISPAGLQQPQAASNGDSRGPAYTSGCSYSRSARAQPGRFSSVARRPAAS